MLDGFYRLIRGKSADFQINSRSVDRLMVEAVDRDFHPAAAYPGQQGILNDMHVMGRDRICERLPVGNGETLVCLAGYILVDIPAKAHIDDLCAAADAQQRLFMLRRGAAQRQLHVVAQAVGAGELGHRALAVIGGRNVAAARQHKAAAQRQPLSHARAHGVGRGGQQQRKAARAFHRAHVIVPCGIGGVHLPRAGRDDPDYRLHAFTLPFGAAQALRPHAHILSIALFHCCWPCVKASVGGVLERAGTALR